MGKMLSVCAGVVAVGLAGCSGAPLSPLVINGKWTQTFSFPGNFYEMELVQSDGVISGTGNACGEAGPCGTLGISGTIAGPAVHLDIVSTITLPQPGPTTTSSFDGHLISPNRLIGLEHTANPGEPPGPNYSIEFRRE